MCHMFCDSCGSRVKRQKLSKRRNAVVATLAGSGGCGAAGKVPLGTLGVYQRLRRTSTAKVIQPANTSNSKVDVGA